MRTKIGVIKSDPQLIGQTVTVKGWVRTVRGQKSFTFIEVNDGSTLSNLQIIADTLPPHVNTGASLAVKGKVVESPGGKQSVEVHATEIEVIGHCDAESYPLQKKRHSFEFLRDIAHLRPRTNTIGAVSRIRNQLAYASHRFFQEQGFLYLHTPIITLSDCEGAGKLFNVSTLDKANPPRNEMGEVDHSHDFFSKEAYLTVSGQLNAEIYACALSDVYTFGPTFRAENSHTSRHLAEFWMIEPEMAFADIHDDMDLAERYLKAIFKEVLDTCPEDMELFDRFVCKGVMERLQNIVEAPFQRITYTEAVNILLKSGKQFEFPIAWGCDLQSEHERFLCEEHFKQPIIVHDYPAAIKSFYMRNNDDGKTVAAMDVLVPGVGEIIGGSQREERLDILEAKMGESELDKKDYWWYLELRKYGSVPHAGFGAGFERLVQFVTGMENIRDVIAFPRYPGHADF
ncbi:MAG: Asparagine--tRNA ligase [Chlamydiales bacterium]|nr:Asparagine--tRNA ligase [Chlamydiales bacterium]